MKKKGAILLFPEKERTTALPGALGATLEPVALTAKSGARGKWTPTYLVSKEWSTYAWLCDDHVTARKKGGWTCKETMHRPGSLVNWGCDDCALGRLIS